MKRPIICPTTSSASGPVVPSFVPLLASAGAASAHASTAGGLKRQFQSRRASHPPRSKDSIDAASSAQEEPASLGNVDLSPKESIPASKVLSSASAPASASVGPSTDVQNKQNAPDTRVSHQVAKRPRVVVSKVSALPGFKTKPASDLSGASTRGSDQPRAQESVAESAGHTTVPRAVSTAKSNVKIASAKVTTAHERPSPGPCSPSRASFKTDHGTETNHCVHNYRLNRKRTSTTTQSPKKELIQNYLKVLSPAPTKKDPKPIDAACHASPGIFRDSINRNWSTPQVGKDCLQSTQKRHCEEIGLNGKLLATTATTVPTPAVAKEPIVPKDHTAGSSVTSPLGSRDLVSSVSSPESDDRLVSSHFIARPQRDHRQRQAVLIQAHIRGYVARKVFRQTQKQIVCLQGIFRRKLARRDFMRKISARKVVQQVLVRFWCQRQRQRSVVKLQAWIRGVLARTAFCEQKAAAKVRSVVSIQSFCRSCLAKRQVYELRVNQMTIRVQSSWRSRLCQRRFSAQKKSVVVLQGVVRRWISRKRAAQNRLQCLAMKIQTRWRGHVRRVKYQNLRSSVLLIQKTYRSVLQVRTKQRAATRIQSSWRAALCRSNFTSVRRATILAQALFRSYASRKKIAGKMLRQSQAALKIQTVWRSIYCRMTYCHVRRRIIAAQALLRMAIVRRRLEATKSASIFIQRHFRGFRSRTAYRAMKQSAVRLQACQRRSIARRAWLKLAARNKCASNIQRLWRGYLEKTKFRRTILCVKRLQSFTRSGLVRKKYKGFRRSIVCLQQVWRGARARARYCLFRRCVILAQCCFRRHRAQVELCKLSTEKRRSSAAIQIQKCWRCFHMRSHYRASVMAARRIQKSFRKHRRYVALKKHMEILTNYMRMLNGMIKIQASLLASSPRKSSVVVPSKQIRASINIQRVWRGSCARRIGWTRNTRRIAAVSMQAAWRAFRCRSTYVSKTKANRVIQLYVRKFLVRAASKRLEASATASIVIQKNWRSSSCRRHFLLTQRAAILVQGAFRKYHWSKVSSSIEIQKLWCGSLQRASFQGLLILICILQAFGRASLALDLSRRTRNVTIIQRYWRGARSRINYNLYREAAIRIQVAVRYHCLRSKQKSASVIQKMVRGRLARCQFLKYVQAAQKLQRCVGELIRRRRERHFAAAVVIQKYWRRHQTRHLFNAALVAVKKIQAMTRCNHVRKEITIGRGSAIRLQKCHVRAGRQMYGFERGKTTQECISVLAEMLAILSTKVSTKVFRKGGPSKGEAHGSSDVSSDTDESMTDSAPQTSSHSDPEVRSNLDLSPTVSDFPASRSPHTKAVPAE